MTFAAIIAALTALINNIPSIATTAMAAWNMIQAAITAFEGLFASGAVVTQAELDATIASVVATHAQIAAEQAAANPTPATTAAAKLAQSRVKT